MLFVGRGTTLFTMVLLNLISVRGQASETARFPDEFDYAPTPSRPIQWSDREFKVDSHDDGGRVPKTATLRGVILHRDWAIIGSNTQGTFGENESENDSSADRKNFTVVVPLEGRFTHFTLHLVSPQGTTSTFEYLLDDPVYSESLTRKVNFYERKVALGLPSLFYAESATGVAGSGYTLGVLNLVEAGAEFAFWRGISPEMPALEFRAFGNAVLHVPVASVALGPTWRVGIQAGWRQVRTVFRGTGLTPFLSLSCESFSSLGYSIQFLPLTQLNTSVPVARQTTLGRIGIGGRISPLDPLASGWTVSAVVGMAPLGLSWLGSNSAVSYTGWGLDLKANRGIGRLFYVETEANAVLANGDASIFGTQLTLRWGVRL